MNPAATLKSLSSRRAWIEIETAPIDIQQEIVALLAEGVDRNIVDTPKALADGKSLSSRRAWIEMLSPIHA